VPSLPQAALADRARDQIIAIIEGQSDELVIRAEDKLGPLSEPLAEFISELAARPDGRLRQLGLRGLGLDGSVVPSICRLLFASSKVASVDLSENQLGAADIEKIVGAVPSYTSVTQLSVASTATLPTVGVLRAALDAAKRAQTLQRLVLLRAAQLDELRIDAKGDDGGGGGGGDGGGDAARLQLSILGEIAEVLNARAGAASPQPAAGASVQPLAREGFACVTEQLHARARDQAAQQIAGQLASMLVGGVLSPSAERPSARVDDSTPDGK